MTEKEIERNVRHIKYLLIFILFFSCFDIKCSCSPSDLIKIGRNERIIKKELAKKNTIYIKDGYSIKLDAYSNNGYFKVKGSISGGKPCKELMITVLFKSKSNTKAYTNLIAKNVGPNKTVKLRDTTKIKNKIAEIYEVKDIDITELE